MPSPLHSKRGFTLVELLVVLAVVAIIAGLSLPVVSSLAKSGQTTQTITELSGIMEMARQYAVAQNTYVWVTFANPDPNVPYRLDVAVLASADGTELLVPGTGTPPGPSTWGGSPASGSPLIFVSPVRNFPLTNLAKAGTVIPSTPPSTPGTDIASTSSFAVTVPGNAATTTFTQVIEFTPTGEARVATGTPINLIEFDLQPYKGPGTINPNNGAVIQVDGLTGAVHIYRQ